MGEKEGKKEGGGNVCDLVLQQEGIQRSSGQSI